MLSYKDTILNFLDIETTGTNYKVDKIIEVYVVKVKNNQVIDTYHTLLNPGFRPNPYITKLTNISYSDLKEAPVFEDVADDLFEFIKDGIVVAHNARFDYSFIKNHLKDYGLDINLNYCCTVKLSRYLYPQYKRHNLDSIIERIRFDNGERHRASYDTEATRSFFYYALDDHVEEEFLDAFNKSVKQAAIPESLRNFKLDDIPETPGVYLFYDENDYPLYIGMSKHLRRRVLEHFYNDLTNSKDLNINQKLKRIEVIPTAGILGALIRESMLIKKFQPLYNRKLRRNRNMFKLEQFIDENGYINAKINGDNNFNINALDNVICVFQSKMELNEVLQGLAKEHGLCPKLLGLEKGSGACFSYQLGKCKGACCKKISVQEYNQIFEKAFKRLKIETWPLESEVVIKEELNGTVEELTFNKWCLIKSTSNDIEISELDKYKFDFDTYKILKSYLKSNAAILLPNQQ